MTSSETICCSVTGWFYRRTILPGVICLAIAGWFFFDGLFVYPPKMRMYQEYRAYTLQRDLMLRPPADPLRSRLEREWERMAKTYPDFSPEMRWPDLAMRYGWAPSNPPEWPEYAKTKGNVTEFTKKHRIHPSDITWQFVTGFIFVAACATFLGNALLSSRKILRADALGIDSPDGNRIEFDRIIRVDNRKWYEQGIARITWRKPDGKVGSTKLDCLKYEETGAEQIMQRIVATPSVEVIPARGPEPEPAQ